MISWILNGCPEMQWSSTGYGIEIRDISAVSPPHLPLSAYPESIADISFTKMVSSPPKHAFEGKTKTRNTR